MSQMLGYVEGADVFLIISLLLFLLFFIGVTIYMIRMEKGMVEKMENMPLLNDEPNQKEQP
jgi:cytochrome c oxidase cbb3-type subunit 4